MQGALCESTNVLPEHQELVVGSLRAQSENGSRGLENMGTGGYQDKTTNHEQAITGHQRNALEVQAETLLGHTWV